MKALKKQFMAAIAMTLVAAIALGSSTYAWFANNNTVSATGMSVTAKADLGFLLIKAGKATAAEIQTDNTTSAAGSKSTAALYPAAYTAPDKGKGKISYFDTAGKWYYKYADSPTASSSTEAATALTDADLDKYVLINEFSICAASGSADMTDLKVKDIDVTTAGDSAVKVLVVSDSAYEEFGVGADQTGTVTLASSVTGSGVTPIKIYVFWDGEDDDVYTNGKDDLKSTSVNVEFVATPAST